MYATVVVMFVEGRWAIARAGQCLVRQESKRGWSDSMSLYTGINCASLTVDSEIHHTTPVVLTIHIFSP